MISILDENIS